MAVELSDRLASHAGRLRLFLTHLAGRRILAAAEIDDLEQEVWLRVLTAPGGPPTEAEGEESLARWLNRIARHTVIDAARALRSARRDGRHQLLERSAWSRAGAGRIDPAAPGPGPATHAASRETLEHLRRAYAELSGPHRRVLGLRQFEGLSAADTARRMGRSEAAVHSLYRRALEAWNSAAGGAGGFLPESAANPATPSAR